MFCNDTQILTQPAQFDQLGFIDLGIETVIFIKNSKDITSDITELDESEAYINNQIDLLIESLRNINKFEKNQSDLVEEFFA